MLRFYQVLFVLAGVLFFAGFALLDAGWDLGTSLQGEQTFGIPAGAQWHYAVELSMQEGGRVHIVFEETSQRAIQVYLLLERDYRTYQAAGVVLEALGETTGSSGVLALSLRSAGTYYLVFAHAQETEALPQEVQLRYSFTGVQAQEPDWLLVGFGSASFGLGAVAVTLAARGRLRVIREAVSAPESNRS
ncbi:MAG: hypothetical protein ACE5LS_08250 [Thermoplasmata archaeon]